MVHYLITLLLAPLIAVITIGIVWKQRGKDRYPGLVSSFFLGAMSIIIVLAFQYISKVYGIDPYTKNIRRIIFYSFVVMGLGSELGKFIILRYYSFPKGGFNGPLDSIVYSIVISMGFVFMGNLWDFIEVGYANINLLYAYTVIPANFVFAIVLGFFIGMGKSRENKFVDSMTGLFAASFFHALYSFCFFTNDDRLLMFFSIGVLIIVFMLYYKAFEMNEEYKRIKNE